MRAFGRENDVPPEIFMPLSQAPQGSWNSFQRAMTVVAKARTGATIAPALRAAVKRVDPLLPLYDLQTMDDVLTQSTASRRFNTLLLSLLGLTGLVLAAIGIYGVIAFFVSQRTHEIGVRSILIGGVAAYWATGVLGTMLFEVNARDPIAFTVGAVVLLIVALGASWLPARRAARVAPVQALAASG